MAAPKNVTICNKNLFDLTQCIVPGPVTSLQVRPSTTIFGLIITWGPPSGSNYPAPVTYQLRYRERPSSGSTSCWSSTVQRTATQRQYTTPVLKPGTRYEVEIWTVTSCIGRGQSLTRTATTYGCKKLSYYIMHFQSNYYVFYGPGNVYMHAIFTICTIIQAQRKISESGGASQPSLYGYNNPIPLPDDVISMMLLD